VPPPTTGQVQNSESLQWQASKSQEFEGLLGLSLISMGIEFQIVSAETVNIPGLLY
jgi:hypothetical protein